MFTLGARCTGRWGWRTAGFRRAGWRAAGCCAFAEGEAEALIELLAEGDAGFVGDGSSDGSAGFKGVLAEGAGTAS